MVVLVDSPFGAQSLTALPGRQGNAKQENASQNVA